MPNHGGSASGMSIGAVPVPHSSCSWSKRRESATREALRRRVDEEYRSCGMPARAARAHAVLGTSAPRGSRVELEATKTVRTHTDHSCGVVPGPVWLRAVWRDCFAYFSARTGPDVLTFVRPLRFASTSARRRGPSMHHGPLLGGCAHVRGEIMHSPYGSCQYHKVASVSAWTLVTISSCSDILRRTP